MVELGRYRHWKGDEYDVVGGVPAHGDGRGAGDLPGLRRRRVGVGWLDAEARMVAGMLGLVISDDTGNMLELQCAGGPNVMVYKHKLAEVFATVLRMPPGDRVQVAERLCQSRTKSRWG